MDHQASTAHEPSNAPQTIMVTLDDGKRAKLVRYRGRLGYEERVTTDCTGCTDGGDCGSKVGPIGCSECGYTGRRRMRYWLPLTKAERARLKARRS